jgi:hypothetical protein
MFQKLDVFLRRKQSSGMWRHVDVVLTDVSKECIASIFRVDLFLSSGKGLETQTLLGMLEKPRSSD